MKKQVTKSSFLDWYFSEKDDLLNFARWMIDDLTKTNGVYISIQDLFSGCGYIPASIVENDDTDNEYLPEECELIF
jgi:hypothetical protein